MYTSATLSLAILELLVHVDPDSLPPDLVVMFVELPESLEIETLRGADLPADWRAYPAPESLQRLGTDWVRAARTPVLSVPSAIVPQERNYLLNPRHPRVRRLHASRPEPFTMDPRLGTRRR